MARPAGKLAKMVWGQKDRHTICRRLVICPGEIFWENDLENNFKILLLPAIDSR